MMSRMVVQTERVCKVESRLSRKPVYIPLTKTVYIFDNDFKSVKVQSGNSVKGDIV